MAVVVGKGSFRGFDQSFPDEVANRECSSEESISDSLQKISRNTQKLKKMIENLGTPMDSRDLRNQLSDIQSETHQMTRDTNLAIKQYMDSPCEDEDQAKEKTIQLRRFKEGFHEILKDFSDQQKIIRAKEREFIRSSLLKSGCFDIDVDESGDLYKDGHQIQVEEIKAEVDLDLIKEREQTLKQIEQDICDINDIFKDLAEMVEEQGEDIKKAEKSIIIADKNISTGLQDLEKANNNVSAARRKTFLLIVIVVTVVLVVLTIVLAAALS